MSLYWFWSPLTLQLNRVGDLHVEHVDDDIAVVRHHTFAVKRMARVVMSSSRARSEILYVWLLMVALLIHRELKLLAA